MNDGAVRNVRLSSDSRELAGVRDVTRHWLMDAGWDEHAVADIVLALDEALTNVIRHGYQGMPGQPIEVRLSRIDDQQRGPGAEIEVRDYAPQVPLDCICGRDLDDLRPGGLGVHLIRSLMDEAVYQHIPSGGTRLTMRRFRSSGSKG